jgi:23S rRNA (uracil1939-C5)-methyltransferase
LLVEEVTSNLSGGHAVDLYAGVGLFSRSLAKKFEKVDSIERGGPAYRDLVANTASSDENINAAQATSEDFLRALHHTPDAIVADPPRAGLGRDTTAELLRIAPPRLTIVSCDPATLARDLRALLPAYQLRRVTLIDLFPQTFHFETIAHLERAAPTSPVLQS